MKNILSNKNNYIPFLGILLLYFINFIHNDILFVSFIVAVPVLFNAVAVYLNSKKLPLKQAVYSNIFSLILQIILPFVFLFFSDSEGQAILQSFIAYIIISDIFVFLLAYKMIRVKNYNPILFFGTVVLLLIIFITSIFLL